MKKLLKSFTYAASGIIKLIKSERNFRIHFCFIIFVSFFSCFFELCKIEYAILFLTFGIVLAAEAFNTSIENLCDLYTNKKNEKIKIIKDISSGAVLICAAVSVLIGFCLFLKPQGFINIYNFFIFKPFRIIAFTVIFVLAILFIFYSDIFKKRGQ